MQEADQTFEKQATEKLESQIFPAGPPDREFFIYSEEGCQFFAAHFKAQVSPNKRQNDSPRTPSPVQSSSKLRNSKRFRTPSSVRTSPKLTSEKTGSAMPKRGRKDYTMGEAFDEEESSSKKSTPAWIGKVYPPAKKAVHVPGKPATNVLPEVKETLAARNPTDRELILAAPQAIAHYLNDLRYHIPDGTGPDGDLLSIVISNKLGALVEAALKCEDELSDLYKRAD